LYSETHEKYFFHEDEMLEYIDLYNEDCECEEDHITVDSLMLYICEPNYARQVEEDYWEDALGEGGELPDEINTKLEALNEAIREYKQPLSWSPGKTVPVFSEDVKP
jgi:hypothetical protein